jgi:hypothetical protein
VAGGRPKKMLPPKSQNNEHTESNQRQIITRAHMHQHFKLLFFIIS